MRSMKPEQVQVSKTIIKPSNDQVELVVFAGGIC